MKRYAQNSIVMIALALISPALVFAEADTFGLGTGRNGDVTFAANATPNVYTALTAAAAAAATSLSVASSAGYAAGDLVMVWQATGLTQAASSNGTPAAIDLSASAAGRYEFARINAVTNATTIELTNPLLNAYAANQSQVVRVPEYKNVTINNGVVLAPQAWNGATGGVLIFFATGTVTNNGSVDANAAGFRGGVYRNVVAAPRGCNALDGQPDLGFASKGEGLVPTGYSANAVGAAGIGGRGVFANAGGGGDCHNAGGGGGGNGSAGGLGGFSYSGDDGSRDVGGFGGAALSFVGGSRLVLGGGGGAGDSNNDKGTAGGAGGGVIYVRANVLAGSGVISAKGATPPAPAPADGWDGAGGGGAGGTIALRIATTATCGAAAIDIDARGGNGGDSDDSPTIVGPGGGGGGGHVLLEASSSNCGVSTDSGLAGTQPVGPDSHGAQASPSPVGVLEPNPGGFAPTTCDTNVNSCGGCVDNTFCSVATPMCNTTSHQCEANGGGTDTDGDGVGDAADVDDDNDGIPDSEEDSGNTDVDGDGIVNSLDLDSDNDGIPDTVEAGFAAFDADKNGRLDVAGNDTDGDGWHDGVDDSTGGVWVSAATLPDTDNDGIKNYRDLDSDADGIADDVEAGLAAQDANNDGRVDNVGNIAMNSDANGDGWHDIASSLGDPSNLPNSDTPMGGPADALLDYVDPDADNDGIPDSVEGNDANHDGVQDVAPANADMDADGLNDAFDPTNGAMMTNGMPVTVPDTDGDTKADYRDADDDGDSILTKFEDLNRDGTGDPRANDTDNDGTPNYLDPDDDNDGTLTASEGPDPNGDGNPADALNTVMSGNPDLPDYLDSSSTPKDTDRDGVPDDVELLVGTSVNDADSDGDGLCDGPVSVAGVCAAGENAQTRQDTDGDGVVDALDADDDGDGVLTRIEDINKDANQNNDDSDGDGIADYLDRDDDGDGILTRDELDDAKRLGLEDEDGDGQPNYLDTDSDGDRIEDAVEGRLADADNDGYPDYLDPNGAGPAGGALNKCSISYHGKTSHMGVALLLVGLVLLGRRRGGRRQWKQEMI